MRRGFHYVNRYVMIRNRLEKNVFRAYYIGLPIFFTLVFLSCAPVSYDFIGTWNCLPDKLTYVNFYQHIKLTFPNHLWEVHTKPPRGILEKSWRRATKADPCYHVMIAINRSVGMITQVMIVPVPKEMKLNEFLAFSIERFNMHKHEIKAEIIINSEVVERNDRTIGLLKVKVEGAPILITAVFKEEGRFTSLAFSCAEALFESNKDQIWAIVDSYEYIE